MNCCEKYIKNWFVKHYFILKGYFTCNKCKNTYYWKDREWILFLTYDEKGNAINSGGL